MTRLATLAALCATLASSAPARADTGAPTPVQKENARDLMQLGDKKLAAGDVQGAADAYKAADDLMKVPTTGLALGRAWARLGLLVEAIDVLQRVARYPVRPDEPQAFAAARAEARALDADVARRVPTVKVSVIGPLADTPLSMSIDGAAVAASVQKLPRRVNPGNHVIKVSAVGYSEASAGVELREGEHKQIELRLAPGAAPPPGSDVVSPVGPESAPPPTHPAAPPRRLPPLAWVGFGVGAIGLGVGAVTGAMSLGQAGALADECPENRCTEDKRDRHDQVLLLANVSNAGFVVGAVGVGVGLVAWLLPRSGGEQAHVEPLLWPGGAGVRGTF